MCHLREFAFPPPPAMLSALWGKGTPVASPGRLKPHLHDSEELDMSFDKRMHN